MSWFTFGRVFSAWYTVCTFARTKLRTHHTHWVLVDAKTRPRFVALGYFFLVILSSVSRVVVAERSTLSRFASRRVLSACKKAFKGVELANPYLENLNPRKFDVSSLRKQMTQRQTANRLHRMPVFMHMLTEE